MRLPSAAPDDSPVVLSVSAETALVLERSAEGVVEGTSDYRAVDGELIPFTTTIDHPLGEIVIEVQSVRFDAPAISPESFEAVLQ